MIYSYQEELVMRNRPVRSQIIRMGEMNPQSSREQLTQVSTDVITIQT
jgi:hypothetical protein